MGGYAFLSTFKFQLAPLLLCLGVTVMPGGLLGGLPELRIFFVAVLCFLVIYWAKTFVGRRARI
jgi:hypothetical protein